MDKAITDKHNVNCPCRDCQFVRKVFGKCFGVEEMGWISRSEIPIEWFDRVILEARKQAGQNNI